MPASTSTNENHTISELNTSDVKDALKIIGCIIMIWWILFNLRISQPVIAALAPTTIKRQKVYEN